MPKYLNPKTWYLLGAGAAALLADGTRRLIKRRKQSKPEISEEVTPAAKPKTKKTKAKVAEVEVKVEEMAEPVVKPVKKAAPKAKAKLDMVEDKIEDVGEEIEVVVEPVVEPVKEVADKVTGEEKIAPEKAIKTADAVPALEFVKARTGKNGSKASQPNFDKAPDDLTEIKGIGPTFARRLTEAGITTFADVAGASPDYLREVTQATAVADPEEWIVQAQSK